MNYEVPRVLTPAQGRRETARWYGRRLWWVAQVVSTEIGNISRIKRWGEHGRQR